MPKMLSLADTQVVADLEARVRPPCGRSTPPQRGGRLHRVLLGGPGRHCCSCVRAGRWGRGGRLLGRVHRSGYAHAATTPARPTPVSDLVGGVPRPVLAVGRGRGPEPVPRGPCRTAGAGQQAGSTRRGGARVRRGRACVFRRLPPVIPRPAGVSSCGASSWESSSGGISSGPPPPEIGPGHLRRGALVGNAAVVSVSGMDSTLVPLGRPAAPLAAYCDPDEIYAFALRDQRREPAVPVR